MERQIPYRNAGEGKPVCMQSLDATMRQIKSSFC